MRLSLFVAWSTLSLASLVRSQATTMTDGAGNVILATIVTDADGDPSETLLVSTLTAATALTTATTATTTAATTTTTALNEGVGQPAVVGAPASRCTTAGCPVQPTVYTQNGVVMTWSATGGLTTPIPTWTSSGNIEAASAYITTISTAKGLKGAAGPSFRNPFSLASAGDWTIMASVAVVGGLVGAVAVL
ncbi:uncharacterized protein JCM15063_002929 [Sporobolomyces koalae]|uniref:uncharacterized protein n=1 Tax=Sporobolomyces koalae TaxID=500713 RepID=UPI003172C695